MNFDVILGLVLLFFAYRVVRAFMKAFSNAKAHIPKDRTASTPPQPAPVYRSPRDLTARPAPTASGSVPRAALRLKTPVAKTPSRLPSNQSDAPFIIDRPRRFPLLGILAVVALIALIAAAHAWLNQPSQPKPPGRNAERALHLQNNEIASERMTVAAG